MEPETPEHDNRVLNTKRRNLLKLAVFGGGAFVLGKVLGPSISMLPREISLGDGDIDDEGKEKETFFDNFRIKENGEELGIYDNLGNEILIIEKD